MEITSLLMGIGVIILGISFLTKPNLFKSRFWTYNPWKKIFHIRISHEDSLKFQGIAFITIGVIIVLFSF